MFMFMLWEYLASQGALEKAVGIRVTVKMGYG